MTIRQLPGRCWVVDDEDHGAHFADEDAARDDAAACDGCEPATPVTQLAALCWVAECDGKCGKPLPGWEHSQVHCMARADLESLAAEEGWTVTGDGIWCPDDKPGQAGADGAHRSSPVGDRLPVHHLVIADLPGIPAPEHERTAAAELLTGRPHPARDGGWLPRLRCLLADAALTVRQGMDEEGPGKALGYVYQDILGLVCQVSGMEGGDPP